jgi:hypothetical protein
VHDDGYDERAAAIEEAKRLTGVRSSSTEVRVPAGYPHQLFIVAGVKAYGGLAPVYDGNGRIPTAEEVAAGAAGR